MIRRTPIRRSSKAKERARQVKELDNLVRELVFARDHHACVRCHKDRFHAILQPSHILAKGHYGRIRWELLNLLTMCKYCHKRRWHDDPAGGMCWLNQTYPGREEQLRVMAATAPKVDMKELKIALELEVQELQR